MINSTWNWWKMLLTSIFDFKTSCLDELHHLEFWPRKDISFHLLENSSYFHFIVGKVKFCITLTENFVSCFLVNIIKHCSRTTVLSGCSCIDFFNLLSLYALYFLPFCLFIKAIWSALNAFSLLSFQAITEPSSYMKAFLFIPFSTFCLFLFWFHSSLYQY